LVSTGSELEPRVAAAHPGTAADGDADGTPGRVVGVLCWRRGAHGVEVLLVHRPAGDWALPRGTVADGEAAPEGALRALAEQTGAVAVLGRPVSPTGDPDRVDYWTGRVVREGRPSAVPARVDRSAWRALAEARDLMLAPGDAAPLDALAAMATAGELDTTPVLVVRHGTARPRDAWARADADRPLVASGRRQAAALAGLLGCWQPDYILSSPWRRCMDTMTPYAVRAHVKIRTKGGLSERGFRRDANKARKHLMALVDRSRASLLCTHRPVLSGVMRALRERTRRDQLRGIPTEDPYLAPGEVLVAHVVHPGGRPAYVVGLERHLVPR
jgi:8-oxo-dGTP diphosphatase